MSPAGNSEVFFDAHFVFMCLKSFKKVHSQLCSILLGLGQHSSHMCFFNNLNIGKVADPKSPSGGSYAFMKPKPQSVEISNSSFVLQFASRRFLDQLLGMSISNFISSYLHIDKKIAVLLPFYRAEWQFLVELNKKCPF